MRQRVTYHLLKALHLPTQRMLMSTAAGQRYCTYPLLRLPGLDVAFEA